MVRTFVKKSRRALSRYLPPQITRHLPAALKGPKPIAGPPPGISIETLGAICAEHLGGHIRQCAHEHLPGWKKNRTFRLHLVAENGTKKTFIFKNETYTREEIPALDGLPVLPGPPEYHVYKVSANSPLSAFLPKLFWCAEIEPGRHFRYLLEDLGPTYRRLHFRTNDLLFAVRVLGAAHKAMKLTLAGKEHHNLIRYDETYSERMLEYSRSNLEVYSRKTRDSEVREVIKSWATILKHRETEKPYCTEFNQPVHGDYNLSNIYWKSTGDCRVKIIDWEWAGMGVPHVDLAGVLRGVDTEVEKKAIEIFACAHNQLSMVEHARLLRSCQLERNLAAAGLFARQHMASEGGVAFFQRSIRHAVGEVLAIVNGSR